jgi:beta-N-acetylhexosaminidase
MKIHLHPKLRAILQAMLCLSLILIVETPMIAQAQQSWDDIDSIVGNTPFYDPNACAATSNSTLGSAPVGNASDNEKTIWNWLVGQGLSGAQAAGIMGNLEQESGFDPTIIQGGGNSNDPHAAGGGGWGLVQWTPGAKVLQDQSGAKATGSIDAIQTQLQIAWWEAQGNGLWAGQGNTIAKVAAVNGSDNSAAEQVASIWVNDYEHAGIIGPRGADADQILATAKQQGWPNANATSASGSLNQGNSGSASAGANAASSCCDTGSATGTSVGLGTFSSLTGDLAISGTFILGFNAGTPKATIETVFKKYKPAGMYILGTSDAAAAGFNDAFYQALALDAGHPIIAASDEEGLFTRYKYNFTFPSAGQMSTMSDSQVQALGAKVGAAMVKNGLNTDLAPVLDIGTGNNSDFHQQPGRTFGTDPNTVTTKAGAFAAGLNSAGINPVYKHFPGLGSSSGNTDTQSVTSPPLSSLEAWDARPYVALDDQNNAGVMMDNAHIPGLTGASVASTSAAAVSLLRNKYSFNGLIMTDDLIATSVGLTPSDALAQALVAGVDAPLETYQSDSVLDAAVAAAKTAKVNTTTALGALDNFAPITNSGTNTANNTTQCSSSSTATTGTVTNPFPTNWIPNRLDMGYDGTFKGQIVAPFDGTIQYAGGTNGWNGSYMVVIKANSNVGLPNSQSLYFTEGVKPIVKSGDKVKAGTPIADAYPSPYGDAYATTPDGSGQIEWGVADGGAQQGVQPNTEAVILGFPGTCVPSAVSKTMVLAFYKWAQTVAKIPGNATTQQCAGAN